jgi:CRISPR/Cas system-associated exonuclease Cas4 (RecB family)
MIKPEDMKRLLNSPYRLLAPVERLLLENNARTTDERDSLHLHPSEICKKDWCPRSSWYKIKGYPEPIESFTLQRLNIFAEGHLIHQKWQNWLTEAGVMVAVEVPVIDEEHLIMGHADGIISDKNGRAVLEIKSLGVGTIRMEDYGLFAPYGKKEITIDELWNRIKKPFDSHVRQTQLYMHCLGIHEAVILYEWKATQDVKEFSIQFQPDIVDGILASCHTVVRALEDKAPPERPTWLSQDHRVCKNCNFKKECWSDTNSTNEPSSRPSGSEVPTEVRVTRTPSIGNSVTSQLPRRVTRQ